MNAKLILFSALAASLLCGQVPAQQDQPSRSYHRPIVRLDDTWLMPLSAPPEWRDPVLVMGRARITSPLLGVVMTPQRILDPAPLVSIQPTLSERVVPPPTVNDASRQKSHFEILRLSW